MTILPEARRNLVAFQASKGTVSACIHRYMEAVSQKKKKHTKKKLGDDLRGDLTERF